MKRTNEMGKALFLCLMLGLCACTPAPKPVDTYTSSQSGETLVLGDREACITACNSDYDRCTDSLAATNEVGRGQMTGVLGAKADCRADLSRCLMGCKGR